MRITTLVALLLACGSGAEAQAQDKVLDLQALGGPEKAARLRASQAIVERERTQVDAVETSPSSPDATSIAMSDLLRNFELKSGVELGTLRFSSGLLNFNVAKSLNSIKGGAIGPFAPVIGSGGASSVGIHATTELDVRPTPAGDERIATLNGVGAPYIARVSKPGYEPVTVLIPSVDLEASQQPGEGSTLPVTVRVGPQSRTMQAGETASFGAVDVEVLYSTNLSTETAGVIEAAPYGLAVRVRGARVPN